MKRSGTLLMGLRQDLSSIGIRTDAQPPTMGELRDAIKLSQHDIPDDAVLRLEGEGGLTLAYKLQAEWER